MLGLLFIPLAEHYSVLRGAKWSFEIFNTCNNSLCRTLTQSFLSPLVVCLNILNMHCCCKWSSKVMWMFVLQSALQTLSFIGSCQHHFCLYCSHQITMVTEYQTVARLENVWVDTQQSLRKGDIESGQNLVLLTRCFAVFICTNYITATLKSMWDN